MLATIPDWFYIAKIVLLVLAIPVGAIGGAISASRKGRRDP